MKRDATALQQDKRHERTGWVVSVGVHALLLLAFLFWIAYRPPNPPLPEYGVELNFGLSSDGYGPVVPVEQPSSYPETAPQEPADPTESAQTTVTEESDESDVSDDVLTNDLSDGPSVAPEEKKAEKPVEKPTEEKKVNQRAVFDASKLNNNGDEPGTTGDKGSPTGDDKSRIFEGIEGGGGKGGTAIQVTGWVPDYIPKVNDPSGETGIIAYEIKVDREGSIIAITLLEKTVSSGVERIYRKEVEKLTFSKKEARTQVAEISTGKVTFVIRQR